jgi:hypothetical protein
MEEIMTNKIMKILIIAGVIILVVTLLVFTIQKKRLLTDYNAFKNNKELYLVPNYFEITTPKNNGIKVSFELASFEIPWTIIKKEQKKRILSLELAQNKKISLFAPNDTLEESEYYFESKLFDRVVNEKLDRKALSSRYLFEKASYKTVPGKVNLFTPSKEIIFQTALLTYKSVSLPRYSIKIWYFDTGKSKGFISFNEKNTYTIQIYDPKERHQYVLILDSSVKEKDINMILSTFVFNKGE